MNPFRVLPYDIVTIILSYSDNCFVVDLAPKSARTTYYQNLKGQLKTKKITYILSTINCLSSSSDTDAFCHETVSKIKSFCSNIFFSHLMPPMNDPLILDSNLFVFPFIDKLENIINETICHIFEIGVLSMHNLTDLDITKRVKIIRNWTEDPHNRNYLNSFKKFDLSFNSTEHKIYILPKEIKLLKNLNVLNLSNNLLQTLPEELYSLHQLRILNLSYNNLKKISTSISQLVNLEELYLNNNTLTELPDIFHHFSNLHELYIRANPFKKLPARLLHSYEFGCSDKAQCSFDMPRNAIENLIVKNHQVCRIL